MTDPSTITSTDANRSQERSFRILVVDDNVGSAKLLAILLSKLGNHEVEQAHSGAAAIEFAKTFRPEILLLDIGLGDMSGIDVAAELRPLDEFKNALFVAVTGYNSIEDQQKTKAAGFALHLAKPVGLPAIQGCLALRADESMYPDAK